MRCVCDSISFHFICFDFIQLQSTTSTVIYDGAFDNIDSVDESMTTMVVTPAELIATESSQPASTTSLIVVPSEQDIQSSSGVSTPTPTTSWNKYSGRKLRERKNSKLQTKRKSTETTEVSDCEDSGQVKHAVLREIAEIAFAEKRKHDDELHTVSVETARNKQRHAEELHELQMQQQREEHEIKMKILRARLAAAAPAAEKEN